MARALETNKRTCELKAISSVADTVRDLESARPAFIFNLCEGFRGRSDREMHIAALWELYDIPFSGNPAKTLGLAQDKITSKRLFDQAGIPTPEWAVYDGAALYRRFCPRPGDGSSGPS
ncbi:MAG: hypothetical protein HC888_18890 [Candidatus Competibacteraceae bacterium]|nr:hypothetical protein [Candidatus Competibacteraceae bacterium]